MAQELALRQLLAKPLGKPAYWEGDILSPECKSTPTKPLHLESVTLVCDRRITGLTYIEPTQPEYQKVHVKNSDVFYRGIITIKYKEWLTADGKHILEKELQDRDVRARQRRLHRFDVEPSNLRLSFALSTQTELKVWIQGVKSLPAVFAIAGQRITEGLYLQTKEWREFNVVSLSPETATRSQLYFTRYRFRRELENIVKLSKPSADAEDTEAIPLHYRTVDWFITHYIMHILSGEATPAVKTNLRTFFAAHCDWLIKDQEKVLHKHRRLIDVKTWRKWYQRWQSRTLPDSDSSMDVEDEFEAAVEADNEGMDMDGASPPPAARSIKRVAIQGTGSRKRPRIVSISSSEWSPLPPLRQSALPDPEPYHRSVSSLEYTDPADDALPPERESPAPGYYRHPTAKQFPENVELDPDFDSLSEDSSDDDASDDSFVMPPRRTDPDVLATVPAALSTDPRLPSPGGAWYCPIEGCAHELDMYNLPDDESVLKAIKEEERAWVNACNWSWRDPYVISIFMDLVSAHYMKHLEELGIEVVGEGAQRYFRWINPEEHPLQHAKSRREVDDLVQQAENLHMS